MDTSRLSTNKKFTVLDLTARVAFRSASSVSFDIGRLWSPEGSSREKPIGFNVIGWIDVHHPCEGHIKTQLRARIPADYLVFEQMKAIIHAVFEIIAVSLDETYEATFFSSDKITRMEQATDRNRLTDRIY